MTDEQTPTEQAIDDLGEAVEQEAAAVEEAVEEVVEEVAEAVADATETATEAATEAAETIEEAVETAVEAAGDLTPEAHGDEVYNRVLQRLREEGHIPSDAVAEEVAGSSIEVVESPVEEATDAPAAAAATPAVVRDTIRPRSEHPWYRSRKVFGREF